MEKNSIFSGIIVGILVPVIGYFLVEGIFDLLISFNLMDGVTGQSVGRRLRTMALLAICCNLIPFNIAKNNFWDKTLRGIVFPTVVYVGFWVYKFKDVLFEI